MEREFGGEFYNRFYGDPKTRVTDLESVRTLAGFVCSYLKYLNVPVGRILDMGCGVGYWKTALNRLLPGAEYTGVEYSSYLCGRYGWKNGSAADFRSRKKFDLIICQSVLQYLNRQEAEKAVENMARLCRGAMYLEAPTRRDWNEVCDQKVTDGDIHLRQGRWYRQLLKPHFINCGGGVFLSRKFPGVMYELEILD